MMVTEQSMHGNEQRMHRNVQSRHTLGAVLSIADVLSMPQSSTAVATLAQAVACTTCCPGAWT